MLSSAEDLHKSCFFNSYELILVGSHYNPLYELKLTYEDSPCEELVLQDIEKICLVYKKPKYVIIPHTMVIYKNKNCYVVYISSTAVNSKHKFEDEIKNKFPKKIIRIDL